jgi:hypothetical protein
MDARAEALAGPGGRNWNKRSGLPHRRRCGNSSDPFGKPLGTDGSSLNQAPAMVYWGSLRFCLRTTGNIPPPEIGVPEGLRTLVSRCQGR